MRQVTSPLFQLKPLLSFPNTALLLGNSPSQKGKKILLKGKAAHHPLGEQFGLGLIHTQ